MKSTGRLSLGRNQARRQWARLGLAQARPRPTHADMHTAAAVAAHHVIHGGHFIWPMNHGSCGPQDFWCFSRGPCNRAWTRQVRGNVAQGVGRFMHRFKAGQSTVVHSSVLGYLGVYFLLGLHRWTPDRMEISLF